MIKPAIPKNENLRQQTLDELKILDTLAEEEFNNIVKIASEICKVPISLISFVDKDRQWFKAKIGLNTSETMRDIAFCAHAINSPNELFEVKDALKDERFFDNPLVTADPKIRYYAGAPLVDKNGLAFGTLCVLDDKPRMLNGHQKEMLDILSKQVSKQLEIRKILP